MQELMSEGVVLHAEPRNEFDQRISVFTRKFGKITAKVRSSRKITSKLAGHIQPGNVVHARFVYVGGHQLVDALKRARLELDPQTLYLLNRMIAEHGSDEELWTHLTGGSFEWRTVLRILGWDPDHAACRFCRAQPAVFRVRDQEFFCGKCALKAGRDEVILV